MRPLLLLGILLMNLSWLQSPDSFTPEERANIVVYWNEPGRYAVALPDTMEPWQVRLTVEGSQWFLKYQRAIGSGNAPPTEDTTAGNSTKEWKDWVQAKLAYDRWQAEQVCLAANLRLQPQNPQPPIPAPPLPSTIPMGLLTAVGNPPPFASAVVPMKHTILFSDDAIYTFLDNTRLPSTYGYYRYPQGVAHPGKALTNEERQNLFGAVGLTDFERKVMMAVSRHEGSFDAINTYDTGFVSIGFIQFITNETGNGSLRDVLLRMKQDNPEAFDEDFRRYGMDVSLEKGVVVVDPATGAELSGAVAVQKIISEKRLTAIFQNAARKGQAFKFAQIHIAKQSYYPADDTFAVKVGEEMVTGKVSEVVKSEAGMATLFDRKVNRGNIQPFPMVVEKVMKARKLTTLAEAAVYEKEIIAECKYREDFLKNKDLSQPSEPPTPNLAR